MSYKDANKKGIIPSIVGRFSSSKEDTTDNKQAKNERKKRPTSMLSSKSLHRVNRSSGDLFRLSKNSKGAINTSEWVESMEYIKDKGMTKKKKKHLKKKNGVHLPPLQQVQLKHAPSIAGIIIRFMELINFFLSIQLFRNQRCTGI